MHNHRNNIMDLSTSQQALPVAVVMLPFPAQGHLNQLLHLGLLLAGRSGLQVHYAAPTPQLLQAQSRVNGWDPQSLLSLHFHPLDLPAFASPPPDPTSTVQFPAHLQPLFETFVIHARAPLASLLGSLSASSSRVVVVYDRLNAFTRAEVAKVANAEAYGFQCVAISYHVGFTGLGGDVFQTHGLDFPPMDGCNSEAFLNLMLQQKQFKDEPEIGIVMNTCREIESDFIAVLDEERGFRGKKLFAIGPLNPVSIMQATPRRRHECLDWLDKQPPESVLYVSFGTTTSFLDRQINELATALLNSGQRFVWVLRDADRGDIFDKKGENKLKETEKPVHDPEFFERIKGRGLMITDWAPQLEILAHEATAAFMSHCGWNSTLESVSHGKAMLTWPMHSDQPWNAVFLEKYLKVGVAVRKWERRDEILVADEIQKVIENVMVEEKGVEMRKRAKKLGEAVRAAVKDGGSSKKDFDDFIAYLTRT